MRSRLPLVLVLALTVAACAPSADLRIPTADGSIQPGRLVIVPLRDGVEPIRVDDGLYETAEFADGDAHDAAFWASLATSLQTELGWQDVRIEAARPDTGFVDTRALVQGVTGGYSSGRWSVKTVSVPSAVDYAAYQADHVLFVRQPSVVKTGPDGWLAMAGVLNGFGFLNSDSDMGTRCNVSTNDLALAVVAQAELVWMDATRDAPVLLRAGCGVGKGEGLAQRRLDRDAWDRSVQRLARSIVRGVTGRD